VKKRKQRKKVDAFVELEQLDEWIATANARMPAAYACIAKGANSPQEAAMLAVLVAKRFCEMSIDPAVELRKLCAVADALVFLPSRKVDG
jgi:hypothetical protein